jgi:hypothetical protein
MKLAIKKKMPLKTCFVNKTSFKTEIKKLYDLIYQYHIRNKKIMFLNVPLLVIKNLKKLSKKTPHTFVPLNIWINGFISNKSTSLYSNFKKHKKQKNIKFFLNLKIKSDLIVNFNINSKSLNIIKECQITKTPIISFKSNFYSTSHFSNYPTYFLSDNFFKINNNKNFIYTILKSILKKFPDLKKNTYNFNKDFFLEKNYQKFYNKNKKKFKNSYKKKNDFFSREKIKSKTAL